MAPNGTSTHQLAGIGVSLLTAAANTSFLVITNIFAENQIISDFPPIATVSKAAVEIKKLSNLAKKNKTQTLLKKYYLFKYCLQGIKIHDRCSHA